MQRELALRLELHLPSQQILQHIQLHNKEMEERIQKGVEAAIAELGQEGVIENMVKEKVKSALGTAVQQQIWNWSFEKEIQSRINKIIADKVQLFAEEIGKKIIDGLTVKQ